MFPPALTLRQRSPLHDAVEDVVVAKVVRVEGALAEPEEVNCERVVVKVLSCVVIPEGIIRVVVSVIVVVPSTPPLPVLPMLRERQRSPEHEAEAAFAVFPGLLDP